MDPNHWSFWTDRPPVSNMCLPVQCPPFEEVHVDWEKCAFTDEVAWIGFETPFWGCCGGTYPDHKES